MPVIQSLKGDRAFQRLRRGRAGHAKLLSLRWRPLRPPSGAPAGAPVSTAFVGIVVSKKVGKAVLRNRVRRRLREALRAVLACAEARANPAQGLRHPAFELVIIARPDAAEADYGQLRSALEHALRKGQLL
ncbi:ribonuclease P protein component [Truepera radiovictrix]|uniref:Ribonuclease P protein component n=1 Tax=Truepera radiovictrix (strain DSM 17093 / CIP 108686 / LMG 22925 / RQ-24) TaxID=649638 RepID=D7CRL7_TRURR|nr:ribonuclease P protein component [Truepera radiovictrix]ADI13507.1 ribonuclease P protein component [Truepera radiovictrix DSM 17093]WMT57931.1 ribonuclease P protein component [Truepera radiovictrix]